MPNFKISLNTISNEYTVFEADQVLTHEQLNGVVDYLTDHDRLTRVDLLGVGIYCGLCATLEENRVKLTRGAGVTTDGDIARVPADVEYTHYKRFDISYDNNDTALRYEKLAVISGVWELIPATTSDPSAIALSEFETTESVHLSKLAAMLFIESLEVHNDLCSDTNCDSRGGRVTEKLRLLLIAADSAKLLSNRLHTPAKVALHLEEIVIDRPLIAGVTTVGGLIERYRAACTAIQSQLGQALANLSQANEFLWDSEPNPIAEWRTALDELWDFFSVSGFGIQYYYGYLKDIAETYAELRKQLSGDMVVCVPDLGAFPKWLVLGRIVPGSGTDVRMSFYPSPIVRAAIDRRSHARFLARKLGVLISAWKLPTADGAAADAIRVTPSLFGDQSLEDRAIPYYYDPAYEPKVHESWSFALSQRGMGQYNQSYHAPGPGGWGLGDAKRPLESNLGRFTFFRVEGHLGRNIDDVIAILQSKIHQYNLPITLATGLLRTAAPEFLGRAADLRAAYDALRAQVVSQLEQAVMFARRATSRIGDNIMHRSAAMGVSFAVQELEKRAADAKAGLARAYDDIPAQAGWRGAVDAAIRAASEFRAGLGTLMTAIETMPLDTLVKGSMLANLDLFRTTIREEEEGSSHPLFISHLEQQPGLEHFAGALRGTTLLLVHDEDGRIIADFMLPCCDCEVLAERDKKAGGSREAVSTVYAKIDATHEQQLSTGGELLAERLANGLRLAPGTDIKFELAVTTDCSVVLELPFPTHAGIFEIYEWGSFGFQRVVLDGTVSASVGNLLWNPSERAARWLRRILSMLLGPPNIAFHDLPDWENPGWKYGAQRQLVYNKQSSPLENEKQVTGGTATYQMPLFGSDILLRVYWPSKVSDGLRYQTGLIFNYRGGDFSLLLYEAYREYANNGSAIHLTSKLSLVGVEDGIARWRGTEHIQSVDITNIPSEMRHPPLEFRITPELVQISEITNTGFFKPWQTDKLGVATFGGLIGAFTTVPAEIWELSDGLVSLQPLQARIRARLHLGRSAAIWDGPPGQQRPFIPDYDTWFWLHGSWPTPPNSESLSSGDDGNAHREEHHSSGTELIK